METAISRTTPPRPLISWLRANEPRTLVGATLATAFSAVPIAATLQSFHPESYAFRAATFGIQFAVCVLLVVLTPTPKPAAGNEWSERDAKIAKDVQSWTTYTYAAWAAMYLFMALGRGPIEQGLFWVADATVGTMLFCLFYELSAADLAPELARERIVKRRIFTAGVGLLLILPELLPQINVPDAVRAIFDFGIAAFNGVAIAMIAGKLGSRFKGLPTAVLGVLYFYAVLQATASQFFQNPLVEYAATTVALPLKCALWGVLVCYYTTGQLMDTFPNVRDAVFTTEERDEGLVTARATAAGALASLSKAPSQVKHNIEGEWSYVCAASDRQHGGKCRIEMNGSGFGLGWKLNGKRIWRERLEQGVFVRVPLNPHGEVWDTIWAAYTEPDQIRFQYHITEGEEEKIGFAYGTFNGSDQIDGKFFQISKNEIVRGTMELKRVATV
jgi:hypothetical protein